jgi:hypothetical protein
MGAFDPFHSSSAKINAKIMGPSVKIAKPKKFGAIKLYAIRFFRISFFLLVSVTGFTVTAFIE